jgi:hypothetical protein
LIRRLLIACLFIGAVVNAVPSVAAVCPHITDLALVEDDLMGSGFEARQERLAQLPSKQLKCRRRPSFLGNAVRAIKSASVELERRDPHLGSALAAAFPKIERDDIVGTMIRSGDSIRFNRAYVLSLNREQLFDHIWQIAASLQSPY